MNIPDAVKMLLDAMSRDELKALAEGISEKLDQKTREENEAALRDASLQVPVVSAETRTDGCDHGVTFDEALASRENLSREEVRKRWPRLFGKCPKGCGYDGIYYASTAHYVYGDW